MSRLFLFTAIVVLSQFSWAGEKSQVEAWISSSTFDGKVFKYEYVVYDASGNVNEEPKINCSYTTYGSGIILKAVDIKIILTGDFTKPGAQTVKKGELNVRQAIDNCQKVSGIKNDQVVPVAVNFPKISVPSRQ